MESPEDTLLGFTSLERSRGLVKSDNVEKIPLSEAVTHILEECRMVLPGIQALFGFQLIVVFNPAFAEKLSVTERGLHLTAISLIIVAIALVMAPAAYHRQRDPQSISENFVFIATRRSFCLSRLPALLRHILTGP